jgi:hypothetical protein
MINDPDSQHLHSLLDKLIAAKFFGQLTVKFSNGKITSVKQEETLELPSFALRKAAENAQEKYGSHNK